MTEMTDSSGRIRVLTDLQSTLLVEAAAGTGKTALLAARLTMLLVDGASPSAIAGITFTEYAASELTARVHRYIEALLDGRVPKPLEPALPHGLTATQHKVLSSAAVQLDELTTATIHAFCQTLIASYAVESGIDPGARMLDASQADAAFNSVFEQWLKRRLNGPVPASDPIGVLSRDDPRGVVTALRDLARFHLSHRSARPLPATLAGRPDIDLCEAVAEFRRWVTLHSEPKTVALVEELERLGNFYFDSFRVTPDFSMLWNLSKPPRLSCMRRDTYELIKPKGGRDWVRFAGTQDGGRLEIAVGELFERVDRCYRTVIGRIAGALVATLSEELNEVLDDYAAFKRAAAVLDFDDLLERARNLVRRHDSVRRAISARYRHILVDEFQDTDPIQCEILFRIAGDQRPVRWEDAVLRPGALFLVGDPKQAIYGFRGADIRSYDQARTAIERQWPNNVIHVTENFRSRPAIIDHVNRCFEPVLSADGQPGYVQLTPTIDDPDRELPCVATLTIEMAPESRAADMRDAEALAVADVCARLIGNLQIRNDDGALVPLTPGGIALLAPTWTQLFRYERALEAVGLPVASQAGKSMFRRQEIQDLLALARVLADGNDTLAFGALMRGPLVGLSEDELLDIAAALQASSDQNGVRTFWVGTDLSAVTHPVARAKVAILQDLRRRSRVTTPALLLGEAIERLGIRAILTARERNQAARAAANVDAFVERARSYAVKGLRSFVHDVTNDWTELAPYNEGVIDTEGDAIQLITMHSAKGLEWPVVIPINTATELRKRDALVYRAADNTLHWLIGDVAPPELAPALQSYEHDLARERERLWYVACTRARELLVVPQIPGAKQRSWARIVDLAHRELPTLDVSSLVALARSAAPDPANPQTREIFEREREAINAIAVPIKWARPSDHDSDRLAIIETVTTDSDDTAERVVPIGAGHARGLVLHKLMEEVLTGELQERIDDLTDRARTLLQQLVIANDDGDVQLPEPQEMAATVLRTLELPDVAALRCRLVPEVHVYALISAHGTSVALAGRADAVSFDNERASIVLDWKSDVAPTEPDIQVHAGQLRSYLNAVGALRGALVYMTTGVVHWITRSTEDAERITSLS